MAIFTDARLRIEPLAVAIRAADHAHVLFELSESAGRSACAVLFEQLRNDAVERAAVFLRGLAGPPRERDVLVAGAPEPDVAMLLCKFAPRRFQQRALGEDELALHRLGHAAIDVPLPAAQILPRADELDAASDRTTSLVPGPSRSGSKLKNSPRPSHVEAHAVRAVEAEQLRRRFVEADAAVGAGEVRGENDVAGLARRFAARRCCFLLESRSAVESASLRLQLRGRTHSLGSLLARLAFFLASCVRD